MYKIIFDFGAIEFLEKAEKSISERIWNKIMSTKENPYHFFERLVGRKEFKLRIGDYRAIADINDSEKKIEIVFIEHRKKVYKNI